MLCLFAPIVRVLYGIIVILIMVVAVLFTMGLILLDESKADRIADTFQNLSNMSENIAFVSTTLHIVLPLMTILGVVVIGCLLLSNKRHLGKIIISTLTSVVGVVLWICMSKGLVG